jgi:small subunit ribosomal protein S1
MVLTLYKDNTARQPEFASNSPEHEYPKDATAKPHSQVISMNPNPTKDSERPTEGPTRTEKDHSMSEDFASVLETFEAEQAAQTEALPQHEGDVIKGTVINLTPTHVVVDIGNKSDGMVPIAEATGRDGKVKFQPGDPIDVVIARGEREEGYLLLSHEKAARHKAWDDIEKAYNDKTNVKGFITERVKGGVTVEVHGVKAFMPGSQIDAKPVHNLDAYKGQEIEVRIVKLNKKRGNIVVSHKQILDEVNAVRREETLKHLEEGAVLTGTVKNLTDYGAFVDLGGIDGLLHITDMSWGRLTHPRDLVHVGDQIHVKVLKFDREKQRVSLGFKQLTPDPWLDAAERYPVSAHVKGRVLSVTDYGAFVELEQGIEGLVHVSEMTWSKRTKHPSKIVQTGQEVEATVLNVNPTERRISLGMKQLEKNPWDTLHDKYPVGATVEGRVRNLTDFGAFIEIEEGIDGLIHVSNMSWTKRIKHPSEVVKKGDKVRAAVLAIEPENRRLSLGMKQLQPDVWETFFASHRVGDLVKGKVLRNAQFGSFVEISEGVEGLCHSSEAVDETGKPMTLEPGDEREFKIVKMNPEEKKVGLSLRAIGHEASRADVEAYKAPTTSSSSGSATLGEIINWKQGK